MTRKTKNIFNFFWLFIGIGIFLSCKSREETVPLKAKGGKVYGGEFRFISPEVISKLFPVTSTDVYSQRINTQLFETLLQLDIQTMEVKPLIAESFQVNDDATVFTFQIRKGIYFHKDPCFGGIGRELTAADVKFSLEMACAGFHGKSSVNLFIDKVKGARSFYEKTRNSFTNTGIQGIKLLDNNSIQIELQEPFVGFDKILTMPNLSIFPPEAYKYYGKLWPLHPVGTGPFILERMDESGIILSRNSNYWRKDELGNQLPFLSKVIMTYAKDKKQELQAFTNKNIDIVLDIPAEEIQFFLGSLKDAQDGKNVKHKVESKSSFSIDYVGFNCNSSEFSNVKVRKAFNYAINRKALVDNWMGGEGWPATNGFVPPLGGFDIGKVRDIVSKPETAKQLLAEAGYPGGKGFPELTFYVNAKAGSSIHNMCLGIADQLERTLSVKLKIKLCTLDELNNAISSGLAKIWRSGWIADYPDAESFLSLFYSSNVSNKTSEENRFAYVNSDFNLKMKLASSERNVSTRNDLYVKCSQIIVDDSPVIPIINNDFIVMVNTRVKNFHTNEMQMLDFSSIFIKDPEKKM